MHTLSIITSGLTLLRAVYALPTTVGAPDATATDAPSRENQLTPSQQPVCVPGHIVAPELIVLKDTAPDEAISQPSGNTLSVTLGARGSNQDQIALFGGFPPGAIDCKFGWKQRKANNKDTFSTQGGNALVEFRPISTLGGPYSFDDVENFANVSDSLAMIDLTSWDQPGFASDQFHIGGEIRCHPEIHVHLRVSKMNADVGGVRLQGVSTAANDSELQGVFVEWKC
ncbi:hypothetical protein NLU13_9164 [Sarocladium strictum]|uniref:Uncharacterized protein n=1 Tax=Sarocladium strictum TaxID=5046 RepID=A0AA39L3M1_SARSR|nr:hypothetical protein NLU13_9164 [Sarocladium strictum]